MTHDDRELAAGVTRNDDDSGVASAAQPEIVEEIGLVTRDDDHEAVSARRMIGHPISRFRMFVYPNIWWRTRTKLRRARRGGGEARRGRVISERARVGAGAPTFYSAT